MKEIMKGCLQLKHPFLSEMSGFAMEHLAHVGKIVSLSLKGLDLMVNEPCSISSCHRGATTSWASLS